MLKTYDNIRLKKKKQRNVKQKLDIDKKKYVNMTTISRKKLNLLFIHIDPT